LRQLITQRSQHYMEDIHSRREQSSSSDNHKKLPHPKKLLHFLAPKIPAIKHSPDVNLRIQTARSDIDSGVAACLLGTLARVCELYDSERLRQNRQRQHEESSGQQRQSNHNNKQTQAAADASSSSSSSTSAATDLLQDRRLEQVVECLLCGVDVKKRKREYLTHFLDTKKREDEDSDHNYHGDSPTNNGNSDDIEELIEGEQVVVREGLNIRDSCRAAWGLAILGAFHCETLGGTKVMDLLLALSLRVRELLLYRLQLFFQGDIMEDITELSEGDSLTQHQKRQAPEERLDDLAEELAEDAAAAMWAFACVRACTGMRSEPLFETCCSILCRDPVELRKRAMEADKDSTIEANNVVDRLLLSEAQIAESEEADIALNETVAAEEASDVVDPNQTPKATAAEDKEALIDWLSPNELTDVLWSLALHGRAGGNLPDTTDLSENAAALKEIAFDRLIALLREDFNYLESQEDNVNDSDSGDLVPSIEKYNITEEGETMTVEVVDAAALLASENAAKMAVVTAVQNMTVQTSSPATGDLASTIEEIEVVDAVTILESSEEHAIQNEIVVSSRKNLVEKNEDEQIDQVAEVFSDGEDSVVATISTSQSVDSTNDDDSEDDSSPIDVINAEEPAATVTDQLYFLPHDLCSLAWAVTELRDSLRFQIVDLVVNIFSRLGEESFDSLRGADLSNLAWAISRNSCDARPWSSEAENHSSFQLTLWVVRRALVASGGSYDEPDISKRIHILDPFQPPELSRLMWAVASQVRSYSGKSQEHYPEIEELAINALIAASANLSSFSPEDLVCGTVSFATLLLPWINHLLLTI